MCHLAIVMQSGPQPDHSPRSSFSQPESASSVSSENRKKDGVQDNPLHAPVRPAGRRLSRAPPKGEKSEGIKTEIVSRLG